MKNIQIKNIQIKNEIPIVKLFYLETTSQLSRKRKEESNEKYSNQK
jgi:hypothetical protein